jgi:hypothetical protein
MRKCANTWRHIRGNPRFNFFRDLRPLPRYFPPMYFLIGGDGKEYGPKAAVEVREWIAEGRLNAQSRIRPQGEEEWVQLDSLLEFAADLNPTAAAPLPQPGAAQPPPQIYQAAPPTYTATPQPHTNPMAITGMICGILSLPMLCCCYGLPFNILGIVFSIIALTQLKANPQQEGKGMAIAGLICSILSFVILAALVALGIAIGITNP